MTLRHRFSNSLKSFDHVNTKVVDDFRITTKSGGLVSIICYIVIAVLIISEFISYIQPDIQHLLSVDNTVAEYKDVANLHFNITFLKLPCPLLQVDLIDSLGHSMLDVHENVVKTRISYAGTPVPMTSDTAPSDPTYCGSCYGAGSKGQCCNTCSEVLKAYSARKWNTGDYSRFEQCKKEGLTFKDMEERKEGCNIHGSLLLSRVLSSFHIAPGQSHQHGRQHVHQLTPESVHYNTSHIVHYLNFGNSKGLGDLERVLPPQALYDYVNSHLKISSFMSKYLLKLVKTNVNSYKIGNSNTYIYSVARSDIKVDGINPNAFPGVYFSVDFTGIQVEVLEKRKSFLAFLVQVCSIVGGIFAFAQILDRFVYSSVRIVQQKQNLGKLS
ncbi:hypothetical protein P9112_013888 [Eukaryota sp. TZLM1-RC]